ncbi:MAG: ABC transporter ATP-binding protein [Planctomycetota bacterium]
MSVARGDFRLGPIDLRVDDGEYVVVEGPSGAGKSTLLEAVAGLVACESGRLTLCGRDATRLEPADRNVGFVPQDGVLFRAMSVAENLTFGLRARGVGRAERRDRAGRLAEDLGLSGLLDRRPGDLSGGERRRVALGRALAFGPPVLLLDEPLASLDDASAEAIRKLLRDLHADRRFTALHASHDVADRALADRVVRLDAGRLATDDTVPTPSPPPRGRGPG